MGGHEFTGFLLENPLYTRLTGKKIWKIERWELSLAITGAFMTIGYGLKRNSAYNAKLKADAERAEFEKLVLENRRIAQGK